MSADFDQRCALLEQNQLNVEYYCHLIHQGLSPVKAYAQYLDMEVDASNLIEAISGLQKHIDALMMANSSRDIHKEAQLSIEGKV